MYKPWFKNALRLPWSDNPSEAECLYLGRYEDHGYPALVPLDLFDEHLYVEGVSGGGKTSRALCPVAEQLCAREDRSVVLIDMKGDSNELLAAVSQSSLPLRWFTDQVGFSTFSFNRFEQRDWKRRSPAQRAVSIAAAMGTVTSMSGHGPQWFQGASLENLQFVLERADVKTPRGLAEAVHHFVVDGNKRDVHHDIRSAGLQAYLDLRRIGSVQALNVIGNPNGIDLASFYETPQVLYIRLPSAGNHALAGVICRLILGALLDVAPFSRRIVKITVVIDEFHRAIAAGMLETVMTQARSMGISLVLANQTSEDLHTREKDFRPTLRACCRLHWLFGFGSPTEQEVFAKTSGFAKTIEKSITRSITPWGTRVESVNTREGSIERYTLNEVKRVCADPKLSFFTSSGDSDLYQHSGYPQVVECDFHIDRAEFERRKDYPWPAATPECLVTEMPSLPEPPPPPLPDEPPPPMESIGRPNKPKAPTKPKSPKAPRE